MNKFGQMVNKVKQGKPTAITSASIHSLGSLSSLLSIMYSHVARRVAGTGGASRNAVSLRMNSPFRAVQVASRVSLAKHAELIQRFRRLIVL